MKSGIYCIKDKKGSFGSCIFEPDDYRARRNLETYLISNPDSVVVTHPFDFTFLRIGYYDDETGVLESDIYELATVAEVCNSVGIEV